MIKILHQLVKGNVYQLNGQNILLDAEKVKEKLGVGPEKSK